MESLHSWTEVLREHIHSLKLPPKELNEMEERSKFKLSLDLFYNVADKLTLLLRWTRYK